MKLEGVNHREGTKVVPREKGYYTTEQNKTKNSTNGIN